MMTRHTITQDDYSAILTLVYQYTIDQNIEKYHAGEIEILRDKKVPENAQGYFIIDEEGYPKCVRFPE